MAETFRIRIFNASNQNQTYFLIQAPPDSGVQTISSVYAQSPVIQSGARSQVTFELSRRTFAICGTSTLTKGAKVSSSSPADVKLGSGLKNLGSNMHLTTVHNSPQWEDDSSVIKAPGGFGIRTDHSFKFPNQRNIYIGIGALDPFSERNILPVAEVTAQPGAQYIFTPKVTYYVFTGEFEEGLVVDISTIGVSVVVNFDQEELPYVAFEHTDKGEYKRLRSFY